MAKRKQGWASELVELVSRMPWWAGVALALASWALMRWIAGWEVPSLADSPQAGAFSGAPLRRILATIGQYLFPFVFLLGAGISATRGFLRKQVAESRQLDFGRPSDRVPTTVSEWRARPIDTSRWSLELLNQLEWKRFEQLCAEYFRELGFRAEVAREGADGGVDIHLHTGESSAPGILVQCKAWRTYKVGIKQIRELFGVMAADQVREGIFVTTGAFTGEAKAFADGKNVHLIDGADLLAKLRTLEPERQEALLRLATEGDYTTPTCPSCGVKMVQREASAGGEPFWGCPNFPRCRTTLSIARDQAPS